MRRKGSKQLIHQVVRASLFLAIMVVVPLAHAVDAPGADEGPQAKTVSTSLAITPDKSFEALMNEAVAIAHRAMEKAPATGDPDRDFVVTMIPHHQGAVDMAKVILRDGKDSDIREFASIIIDDRQSDIEVMTGWLPRYKPAEGEGPNKTFATAMERVRSAIGRERGSVKKTKDPDRYFLRMMIPHCQGAVDMAKLVLMYGKDQEIRRLADQIIAAQQSDIQLMQGWLSDLEEQ